MKKMTKTPLTKAKALTRADLRPVLMIGTLLIAALMLSACGGRKDERVTFDGQLFRASAKKTDKQRYNFEVTVRPVSASLAGAREAGRYEATRYCVGNFGSSEIDWVNGPDGEDGTLQVNNDRLLLTGTCAVQ